MRITIQVASRFKVVSASPLVKRIVTKFPAHLRFNFNDAKVYLCRNLLRSSQQLGHQEFSVNSFNFALKTTFKCIPQIDTFRTCKLRKVTAHPKVITGVGSDDLVTAILGNSEMGLLLIAEYNYLELIEKWVFLKAKKNIPATS